MAGKNLEQANFAVLQLQHGIAAAERARERVEHARAQADLVARRPPTAAQHRPAACLKLREIEWLGNVVIGTLIKRAHRSET